MDSYIYERQKVYNIQKIQGPEEKIFQKIHRPQQVRNCPSTTAMTKTRTYRDPGVYHKSTDLSPLVTDWQPRSKGSYIQWTIVQETGVRHVSQCSDDRRATREGDSGKVLTPG